jgi:hypothetical protein
MSMRMMKVIFNLCISFVIMSCAHAPTQVQFCENNKCAVLSEADSQDAVFQKITSMMKSNLNKTIPLIVGREKEGKTDTDIVGHHRWIAKNHVEYEISPRIHSLTFTDILYIDRETREIKVMAQADISHPAFPSAQCGTYPALSSTVQMPSAITVKSSNKITFTGKINIPVIHLLPHPLCPEFKIDIDGLIDYIDVDKLFMASEFSIDVYGQNTGLTRKNGYLHLSFKDGVHKTSKTYEKAKNLSAKPTIYQQAKESKEIVEIITAADTPQLAYTVKLQDQNNNKVLDGGEKVSLRVEVENTGEGTANDVSIELTGQKEIIDALGNKASIGDIQPKQKKLYEFKGVLPLQIPSGKAVVRVEIVEDKGFSPQEKKSFQIAMRPSKVAKESKESFEVIAAKLPRLAYTVGLQDQDNNKVLDGGEKLSLRVEVENTGEGTANNVSIELSGQKEIIDALGSKAQIGDIQPKQKKVHEFKGVLPVNIPSSTALLRVSLHEFNGYSPARGKSFQIAMKAAETATDQTEIISEVDVDDIPQRIKGAENKNNYAIVIGIGTYRDKIIPKVKYANRDAETMARYLENLAGIPKGNILIKTDSDVTKGDLEDYFENWLPRRVTGDSLVYVYYAGHGTPDPAGKDAYIVPYEGHPDSPGKLYPLTKMYAALTKLPAKQVVVMLDSCFSGVEGRGVISEGTRPLVMSVENQVLTGNRVFVITGAKGNQMSSDYDKVKHGLFTYYLLRGIRGEADKSGRGVVSVGDLYEYVKQSVTRTASLELNRDQTPDLLPGKAAESILSLPIARTK